MAAVMIQPLEHDPREPNPEWRRTARPGPAELTLVAPPRAGGRGVVRRPVPAATYRRRRLVVALVLVALTVVALRAGAALGGSPLAASERPPSTRYVVQPGDTLWSIASHLAPGEDPRPVVDRLAEQHGSADLQPGETIVLR